MDKYIQYTSYGTFGIYNYDNGDGALTLTAVSSIEDTPTVPDTPAWSDVDGKYDVYELVTAPENGDVVVIYNPGNAKALSSADSGYYKAGVEAAVTGENYIASLEKPLTARQINDIKAEVAAAKAEVKKANTGVVENWTQDTRNAILTHIDNAAKAIDCTATANTKGGIDIKDTAGATIVTNDELIKTTGFGAESVVIAGICVLSALCACAFVSKKVRLF